MTSFKLGSKFFVFMMIAVVGVTSGMSSLAMAADAPPTTPTIAPAATAAPALVKDVAGSKDPAPLFNKTAQFSIRTIVNACTGATAPAGMSCTIDTLVVAKATDNGDLLWERQIFSRVYEADKSLDEQMILVKNMKFAGGKTIEVKNARGDTFKIEIAHGHLKSPKSPKVYKK